MIRRIVLVLVLTLVVFGIVGALVTLIPQTAEWYAPEGKAPQVRQIDRENLQKDIPGSGF